MTVTPPAPPILVSPINGATKVSLNPTLVWNYSTEARTYRIQVSKDPTFASIMVDSTGMMTASLKLTGLVHVTKYFWRVNVTISELTSDWSSIWNFTTISPPRISIYPTMVNFGKVVIGTRRDTLITLKNIGGDTLFITSVTSNNSLFVLKNISSSDSSRRFNLRYTFIHSPKCRDRFSNNCSRKQQRKYFRYAHC